MRVKELLLHGARLSGLVALVRESGWRDQRILVLCYHGVSTHDEHDWSPELYITPAHLRQRLQRLRDGNYSILSLADATRRLYARTLPKRSVVLTFDDGTVDFTTAALPILQEFNAPATLYLTTHYSEARLPVFDTVLSYVLWRGRWQTVDTFRAYDESLPLRCDSPVASLETWRALSAVARERQLSTQARDQLVAAVARALGVDYAEIKARNILHIMPPEMVRALPSELIDVQLHTHRHRMPGERDAFSRELADNACAIRASRGDNVTLDHFCYPSGLHHPKAFAWLRDHGVRFATTCEPALASPRTDPLLLPRYVDSMEQSAVTFDAWISGLAAMLPRWPAVRQSGTADGSMPLRMAWKMIRGTPSARSST